MSIDNTLLPEMLCKREKRVAVVHAGQRPDENVRPTIAFPFGLVSAAPVIILFAMEPEFLWRPVSRTRVPKQLLYRG